MLVIDATILISAVLGRGAAVIARAQKTAVLVTTDRVLNEVRRRIELGMKRPELLEVVDNLAAGILVVPLSVLEPLLARSEKP